jgi:hypothetical protein
LIQVDQVGNGNVDHYTFNSDGSSNARVTLVWDDVPAARLAATTLVNDLDLRLEDPDGIVYQPLVLNPAMPNAVATAGNDATNNVEMVIGNAKAGTWEVRVSGTTVPQGPQQYTLITPNDAVANNQAPDADANGSYNTDEGTDVGLDGSASSDPDGDALTFEWDLDNDGMFDDAVGQNPTFDMVGQDGVFTIALRVTDSNGASDIDETTVTVNNVPPSVDLSSDSPVDENSPVTVSGTITDPGWLDPLTATIDWDDETPLQNIAGTLENLRPDATLTFDISHTYGDNGNFVAEVCASDDDTTTCETIELQIDNVNPTAEIDESGAILVNGIPTFIAQIGEPVDFSADTEDPGSDDLDMSWDWDDGAPSPDVTTTSLVNPPATDPLPSPSIQPRDETDMQTNSFSDACVYQISFTSLDDDGASSADNANVIISGNEDDPKSAGFWQTDYKKHITGKGNPHLDAATLDCYLQIAGYMSLVFNEERDASTFENAHDVLFLKKNKGSAEEHLDRQLLAVWLNFANGSFGFDELVDIDGDTIPDTIFSDVVDTAETVRLDPGSTNAELEEQKDILEILNES